MFTVLILSSWRSPQNDSSSCLPASRSGCLFGLVFQGGIPRVLE